MEISMIGLDLAKSIFQVHAVDASGEIVVRKALRRAVLRQAAAVPDRHGSVWHVASLGARADEARA